MCTSVQAREGACPEQAPLPGGQFWTPVPANQTDFLLKMAVFGPWCQGCAFALPTPNPPTWSVENALTPCLPLAPTPPQGDVHFLKKKPRKAALKTFTRVQKRKQRCTSQSLDHVRAVVAEVPQLAVVPLMAAGPLAGRWE